MTDLKAQDFMLRAALNEAAMIDRSGYGRVLIKGKDALDLLHRLSTNDLLAGRPGQVLGTVFTTEKGRIFDYVRIMIQQQGVIAVTSPHNERRFIERIEKYTFMEDVLLTNITASTSVISLVGPLAYSAASDVFDVKLTPGESTEREYKSWRLTVSWTREFDTDFIDLVIDRDFSNGVREVICGWKGGGMVREINPQVYEAFRISRGIPAFNSELSELWNPYEVGLTHAISFTKGCYTGQEVIARLKTYDKVQRKLVGLIFREALPGTGKPHGLFKERDRVGTVTSQCEYPVDGKFLALAIVSKHAVHAGDTLAVMVDQGVVLCNVTGFPIPLGHS